MLLKLAQKLYPEKQLLCALIMDEVAIRQQIEWDGKNLWGIDMGTRLDDDSMSVAKEALTFMVVVVNHSFKVPVGYFLIDGLGGAKGLISFYSVCHGCMMLLSWLFP